MAQNIRPQTGSTSFYGAARYSDTFKEVSTSFTTTGLATLWTPATGKRFLLKGFNLRASLTTAASGATPGSQIVVCDNTVATRVIASLGVITSATEAVTRDFGLAMGNFGEGIPSALANNILACGCANTVGAGVVLIRGTVWGTEIV